jgi:Mor family transcriptional regulator
MSNNIAIDDLIDSQREIAELIGLNNYLKLVRRYGGDSLYIQVFSEITKLSRNAKIRRGFTGKNYRELARQHNLSARRVRQIVPRELVAQKRSGPIADQTTLY